MLVPCRVEKRELQALDERPRRFFFFQANQKRVQILAGAFDLNEYALPRIQDPAAELQLLCQPVDEGPESNPLDHSLNRYLGPFEFHDVRDTLTTPPCKSSGKGSRCAVGISSDLPACWTS